MQAEQKRATEKFEVSSTPTLFINGKMQKGGISIDDLAKVIDPLLQELSLRPANHIAPLGANRAIPAALRPPANRRAAGQYCTVVIWPYSIDFHRFFRALRATETGISRAFVLLSRAADSFSAPMRHPLCSPACHWCCADDAGCLRRGGGANRAKRERATTGKELK